MTVAIMATQENTQTKQIEKKNTYDKGFFTRMGVLCSILVVLAALFAYDRFVLLKNADAAIQKIENGEFDANGDHHAQVREITGIEPHESKTFPYHTLEEYHFNRVLPFMQPRTVSVLYMNYTKNVVDVVRGSYPEKEVARLATIKGDLSEETFRKLGGFVIGGVAESMEKDDATKADEESGSGKNSSEETEQGDEESKQPASDDAS
jgi:hypothetical protein